jgi:hypothetical protein
MALDNLISIIIGLVIGLFLTFSSSYIVKKAFKAVNTKEGPQNQFAALAQGMALASLWLGKLIASVVAIHFSMKAGYSSLYIGILIPVGIVLGILLLRFFDRKKSP